MDITKMLAELKAEREGVEQAILVLERIASGQGKRRGRPPKWMTDGTSPSAPKTFTRSPEARKAQSKRMKAYWAKRKRAEAR